MTNGKNQVDGTTNLSWHYTVDRWLLPVDIIEGVRFTRAYAMSPVCSKFRSAMTTGMHQTSFGAHRLRSGRGETSNFWLQPVIIQTISVARSQSGLTATRIPLSSEVKPVSRKNTTAEEAWVHANFPEVPNVL